MRRPSMVGSLNPNFKNAGWHNCEICGARFHSYSKTVRFCSYKCSASRAERKAHMSRVGRAGAGKPKPWMVKTGRRCKCKLCGIDFISPGKATYCCHEHRLGGRKLWRKKQCFVSTAEKCPQCGNEFRSYPSRPRKYCSYKCHLDSGGAHRAGMAANIMARKYGAKKDQNHKVIADAYIKLGAALIDLSGLGCGVPDLLIWCWHGWHLVDVKNPKTGYGRRGLNAIQKKWAEKWKGGPVYLISTVDEVVAMVNGKFDSLKRFPDDRASTNSESDALLLLGARASA